VSDVRELVADRDETFVDEMAHARARQLRQRAREKAIEPFAVDIGDEIADVSHRPAAGRRGSGLPG
jgi:hypothetical protein